MEATTRNNLKPKKKPGKPEIMPGKPFQSKLGDHYETIRAMRRKRKTWDEVAAHLGTLGVTTSKGSLCAFYKRHSKRPYALGMEPEPISATSGPSPIVDVNQVKNVIDTNQAKMAIDVQTEMSSRQRIVAEREARKAAEQADKTKWDFPSVYQSEEPKP